MSEDVFRRLRWFLLLGAILFVIGIILGCIAALRTSAWMVEWAGKPDEYFFSEGNIDRWTSSVEIDGKLYRWAIVLGPLGAGAILGSFTCLAWATKGRFRLRSLFIGMTLLGITIGLPFGQVWPRLQNPQFVYRPALGDVSFEQHRDPSSNSNCSVLNRRVAITAVTPLLILPVIFFWPKRRPPATLR